MALPDDLVLKTNCLLNIFPSFFYIFFFIAHSIFYFNVTLPDSLVLKTNCLEYFPVIFFFLIFFLAHSIFYFSVTLPDSLMLKTKNLLNLVYTLFCSGTYTILYLDITLPDDLVLNLKTNYVYFPLPFRTWLTQTPRCWWSLTIPQPCPSETKMAIASKLNQVGSSLVIIPAPWQGGGGGGGGAGEEVGGGGVWQTWKLRSHLLRIPILTVYAWKRFRILYIAMHALPTCKNSAFFNLCKIREGHWT